MAVEFVTITRTNGSYKLVCACLGYGKLTPAPPLTSIAASMPCLGKIRPLATRNTPSPMVRAPPSAKD